MSDIEKFLKPRKDEPVSISREVVDTEYGESVEYEAKYHPSTSKIFRRAQRNAQKAILEGSLDADDSMAYILNQLAINASINGTELDSDQNQAFLSRYPQLMDHIDVEISRGSAFIKPLSSVSKDSHSGNSGSKSQSQKTQKQQGQPITEK